MRKEKFDKRTAYELWKKLYEHDVDKYVRKVGRLIEHYDAYIRRARGVVKELEFEGCFKEAEELSCTIIKVESKKSRLLFGKERALSQSYIPSSLADSADEILEEASGAAAVWAYCGGEGYDQHKQYFAAMKAEAEIMLRKVQGLQRAKRILDGEEVPTANIETVIKDIREMEELRRLAEAMPNHR